MTVPVAHGCARGMPAAPHGAACDVSLGNGDFSLGLVSGQSTDTWTRNYTVAAGGRLEVVNVNGLVQVEPGTGPAVEIRAERHAKASSDEAAKDLLGKVQMLEDIKPDSVRVEAKPPKTFMAASNQILRQGSRQPERGGPDRKRRHQVDWRAERRRSLDNQRRCRSGAGLGNAAGNDDERRRAAGAQWPRQRRLHAQTVNGGVNVELPKNAAPTCQRAWSTAASEWTTFSSKP